MKNYKRKNECDHCVVKPDVTDEENNKGEIFVITLSAVLFALGIVLSNPTWEAILYISAYIVAGGKILATSLRNLAKGKVFDENFLMSLATIGAIAIGELPEAVGVMLFYRIGELLQKIAVGRSKRSITKLLNMRPDYANVLRNKDVKRLPPEQVKVGELIIVRPGERVPLDGRVVDGEAMMDTSALTGESLPRKVKKGDKVLSGFVNQTGVLKIEVEREYSESTVARILHMVQDAASKKAKTERFITRFARYYTPIVVGFASCLIVVPVMFFGREFSEWFYKALVFLVISCPCALVISTPLSFFAGLGRLSKSGVLVKGGDYLERLRKLEVVAFDKTGTVTEGILSIDRIETRNGMDESELLKYAAYTEYHSNHPVAIAIKEGFDGSMDTSTIEAYEEVPGKGVKAVVEGKEVMIGNTELMVEANVNIGGSNHTTTVVHIAIDGTYAGCIHITDKIKENAHEVVMALKKRGVKKVVVLTGDNESAARKVAEEIGVDEYKASLLPEEKVKALEELKNEGNVTFVGDGINDAPVIMMADVGVAMGALGSDAAIEAADVVIMDDELSKLVDAVDISRKTINIVWQNVLFALGVKVFFMILGTFGAATMWEAVFADVGVTILVVLNALRIFMV